MATIDLLPVDTLGPYRGEGDGGAMEPPFDHPSTQIASELEARLSKEGLVLAPGTSDAIELLLANRTRSELRGEAQLISPFETWPYAGPWTQGFSVPPGGQSQVPFSVSVPADAGPLSTWLLVKVMYFGRLWYSPAMPFEIRP